MLTTGILIVNDTDKLKKKHNLGHKLTKTPFLDKKNLIKCSRHETSLSCKTKTETKEN
jgi:hypothetical protein